MTSSKYYNFLDELRDQWDVQWITRAKNFPSVPRTADRQRRTPLQIVENTLNSDRVQSAIDAEVIARVWPRDAVVVEARTIVETMAHQFQLTTVRMIGYGLAKVIKRIFSAINVNRDSVALIRDRLTRDAVVFMPTHNTYMDFLLLSLLCFGFELPLPAIAAGMDFMNSRLMGEALRRCGAFFIRRSFGDDRLYWSIFTEYVQTHLVHADRPVEFFIEGTRSRTGKSLHPKYGLLQVLLEPYLRSQVYDLVIVPVSMDYDKILEETLYAYELLGFPKPKESTSGLLKARSILDKEFGSIWVTFGEPISIREYFGAKLERSVHALQPDAQFTVSTAEKQAIRQFGHRIIKIHNRNRVVCIWTLAAAVLSDLGAIADDISYDEFDARLDRLVQLTDRLGFRLRIVNSLQDDLDYYLNIHSNIIRHQASTKVLSLIPATTDIDQPATIPRIILERTIPRIVLAGYANKLMHWYADPAYIVTIISRLHIFDATEIFAHFCWMQKLFEREFVCVPGEERIAFDDAIDRLQSANIINCTDSQVHIRSIDDADLLSDRLQPTLAAYSIVAHCVQRSSATIITEQLTIATAQKSIIDRLLIDDDDVVLVRHSQLSTDLLKNAFHSICEFGAIRKTGDNHHHHQLTIDADRLQTMIIDIDRFVIVPPMPIDWMRAKL